MSSLRRSTLLRPRSASAAAAKGQQRYSLWETPPLPPPSRPHVRFSRCLHSGWQQDSRSLISMRPCTHVIFDLDGLLLDTENLYSKAYQAVLDPYGKEYTFEFKTRLLGKRAADCAKIVVEHYNLPMTTEQFIERIFCLQKELFPSCKWMPGMPKFLHHLYKHQIPIAMATSSAEEPFKLKTRRHSKLFDMFHHVVKGSDPEVIHGKPAPDIYQVCAKRFNDENLLPANCLAFEDAPAGVDSARSAGMQVVMLPDPRLPLALQANATLVLKSIHEIHPEDFGLPPFCYRPVTHVIFDMDGLLLDTSRMYSQVTKTILALHNKEPDEAFRLKMLGRRHVDVAPKVIEHYQLPYTLEEFTEVYYGAIGEMLKHSKLLEGVERLVDHLHENGIPMAVATSSNKDSFQKKIQKHRHIFAKFHHVVTGSDPELKEGKPAPDIFELCARRFEDNVSCADCLVFEDAPQGVQAADSAGMQTVMIPDGNRITPELTLKATQLLTTMSDFRPQDFGLPPYAE